MKFKVREQNIFYLTLCQLNLCFLITIIYGSKFHLLPCLQPCKCQERPTRYHLISLEKRTLSSIIPVTLSWESLLLLFSLSACSSPCCLNVPFPHIFGALTNCPFTLPLNQSFLTFAQFVPDNSFLVGQGCLCIVRYLAAYLNSTYWVSVVPPQL